jgi:hypothetical protein
MRAIWFSKTLHSHPQPGSGSNSSHWQLSLSHLICIYQLLLPIHSLPHSFGRTVFSIRKCHLVDFHQIFRHHLVLLDSRVIPALTNPDSSCLFESPLPSLTLRTLRTKCKNQTLLVLHKDHSFLTPVDWRRSCCSKCSVVVLVLRQVATFVSDYASGTVRKRSCGVFCENFVQTLM